MCKFEHPGLGTSSLSCGLAFGAAAHVAVHGASCLYLYQRGRGASVGQWPQTLPTGPGSDERLSSLFQSQSAVDLAIDLRDNRNIDVEKINSIHVEVAQGAYDVLAGGTYGPKTECRIKEQADHNLMYLLSVALLDGEIWPPQFSTERINRDDVQSLMTKVTAAPNDDFSRRLGPQMPASLSIELEGGEVIKGEKGVFDGFWATPIMKQNLHK
jgi:hypothetical protein